MNSQLILAVLLIINSVFGHDYQILGTAIFNMPFFVVGVILKENMNVANLMIGSDWHRMSIFLVTFVFVYAIGLSAANRFPMLLYLKSFVLGVLGSLFLINLSQAITSRASEKLKGLLMQVGFYSMTIYLFHTLFESTLRIGSSFLLHYINVPFLLIAFTAITCGVVFPSILEKEIFRKYRATKKYLLGTS